MAPTSTVKDYEDRLARLRTVPKLIDQNITLLSEGLKLGVTPPKITLRKVPSQVRVHLTEELEKNALMVPFRSFPDSIPKDAQTKIRTEALNILKEKIIPAFQKLLTFLEKDYIPYTRESIAWSSLPDGQAWYAHKIRHHTTTMKSAEEIHKLGLSEVARIRKEMDEIIKSVGFKGSFSDFTKFLRTDDRFYFTSADELIREYRSIGKKIDPELTQLFGKLPRLPYGVLPVPSYAEESQTTAYYEPGSPDSHRSGYFYANTYNLKARPKWEMEALTLHEAVPGHHLQISLAQEMTGVPEFRKFSEYTAYVEGWGLYAESLGDQLGLYKDPYSRFGKLTYEIWRSIRLVVDTGMHALGWTRDQAIQFFIDNTGKSEQDIIVEVDRYIVWAGQALAYKIGQLKITELRENAKKALGDRFDIREFHDIVLGSGAVPLDVLERQVKAWVAKKRPKKF